MMERRRARDSVCLGAGVLVLLVALAPLPAAVGNAHPLSAHMIQHVLLALVAPPLLLLSVPESVARRWLQPPMAWRVERMFGNPVAGWIAATATLFLWHVPALYDVGMTNGGVRIAQDVTVAITATLFWWAVASPLPEKRLSAPLSVLYLFSACAVSSVLGVIITLAPSGLYASHVAPPGGDDQQIGGLIMWVGCCVVYVSAIMLTLAHWYGASDTVRESASPAGIALAPMEHS